ncbi:hypothetical protein G7K_2322-t1 [Saitoella complicata NRRL Y-17804]|uniref:Uncharacterized protein n=2 Tax=Saitoella complicata (strain BCRC 22490 / CBS 7301 / JCM 7358 / NBRC 10748 / NRRL Y-17804) TaxID=698492 RepID=A0A0E9NFF3_SAICN|nr:hypothetical protein G7K_2322-t1 [Saitoella complicata NRRL Y-17804]
MDPEAASVLSLFSAVELTSVAAASSNRPFFSTTTAEDDLPDLSPSPDSSPPPPGKRKRRRSQKDSGESERQLLEALRTRLEPEVHETLARTLLPNERLQAIKGGVSKDEDVKSKALDESEDDVLSEVVKSERGREDKKTALEQLAEEEEAYEQSLALEDDKKISNMDLLLGLGNDKDTKSEPDETKIENAMDAVLGLTAVKSEDDEEEHEKMCAMTAILDLRREVKEGMEEVLREVKAESMDEILGLGRYAAG